LAVDKLIKENIRKNKNKLEEACIRKQQEEFRQKQRRAELSQRNQEVRMINASKIVHHGGATGQAIQNQQVSDFNIGAPGPQKHLATNHSNPRQANSKEPSHRRRSQSCIDYSNKKAGATTSGGDRRAHHSQGHNGQPAVVQQVPPQA